MEKPKAGYQKWLDSVPRVTTARVIDADLCDAFYAGYEYALKQNGILYGEDARRLREQVFGKKKSARLEKEKEARGA